MLQDLSDNHRELRHRRGLILTLLLLPVLCTCVRAQDSPSIAGISDGTLGLTARSFTDSVRLRWAPSAFPLWQELMEKGIYVDRYTLMRDGSTLPLAERQQRRRLTPRPIRPAPEADFGALANQNRYAAIGGQSIYGERFQLGSGPATTEAYGAILNQAREDQNRFSFGLYAADLSWEVATMMGLGFTDTTVLRNETYLYQLVPAAPIVGYEADKSGYLTVMVNDNAPPPPVAPLAVEFTDQRATLSWDLETARTFYTSYYILRSEDGVTYSTVNRDSLAFVPLLKEGLSPKAYYQDSLPSNNRSYFYKVVGVTPFGIVGPGSGAVQGMGLDPLPSAPPSLASIFPTDADGFLISWTFPEEESINGFRVERATTDQGEYPSISPLLPASTRSYTDPEPLRTNYYRVTVFDQYNRPLSSYSALAQLDDDTPPAVPTGVRGIILNDGRVVLNWNENREEDLLGYRVWFSNQLGAEYSLATGAPIPNNYYIDSTTLNTLSPKFYAKVVSLDYRHNTSDFSEVVELIRPDTIPPAAPLMQRIESSRRQIMVYWAFSQSLDLDRHELQWRPLPTDSTEAEWEVLRTYDASRVRTLGDYRSFGLPKGKKYEYRVVAFDLGGRSTSSKTMVGNIVDDFIRQGIGFIRARADRRAKAVDLTWDYFPENDQFKYFEIWRAAEGERPLPIARVEAAANGGQTTERFEYQDQYQLRMNTRYRYQLKAVYANGAASKLSIPVSVQY